MQVSVQTTAKLDIEQVEGFVESGRGIEFEATNKAELYAWVDGFLRAQGWSQRKRRERGKIRMLMGKITGRSPAQLSRMIRRFDLTGEVRLARTRRPCFARRYTDEDVRLLAEADELHDGLSGPAMRKIFEREHRVFGREAYGRLAAISVAHLYNLRKQPRYRQMSGLRGKTRPSGVSIAERRRPEPNGRPGYVRVDTVHQGDHADGSKGVYHINSVDAVLQWEVVGSVARIQDALLRPLLESMLGQFPFRILGFHADNGSEYINHQVAAMLNRLVVEFTKSRSHHSNDNALVEGKNGAIIRKHMGHGYLHASCAEAIHEFYRLHFNPYLNFHRPCGFATLTVDAQGRRRRRYRLADYQTPFERLQSVPNFQSFLRDGVSAEQLQTIAARQSDIQAAAAMQKAKAKLFASFANLSPLAPTPMAGEPFPPDKRQTKSPNKGTTNPVTRSPPPPMLI